MITAGYSEPCIDASSTTSRSQSREFVGIAFEPTTSGIDLQEPVDRLALTIASRPFWLWRAADGEGEVLDLCSNDAGKRIGLRPHELSARERAPV